MKKGLAVLMLAAMLMSAGCGNTMDGAKKDAQDAAAKVEQKVDNAAKDAAAKADEAAKDAAAKVDDAAKDAAAKVDDAAKDAAAKVDEAKQGAADTMDAAAQKLEDVTADVSDAVTGRVSALGGLIPGSTSLEDVQAMFGEATSTDGNVMTFVNGLKVTFDDEKKVKSISTTGADFDTPEGIYVGASEYALNDYCGPADNIRQIANGAEYEYFSGDKKSKTVYKAQNGIIAEITCELK